MHLLKKTLRTFLCSILSILSLLFFSQYIDAQQTDIERFLKDAPPEIREIYKNLPKQTADQFIKDNKKKGKLSFTILPTGSAFGVKALGSPFAIAPVNDAMKGGTLYATEMDYCDKTPVVKYMYVLELDTNSKRNLFITNQEDNSASITLTGNMVKWEFLCETKEYIKVRSEPGGIHVDFSTSIHTRPRMFQVLAGSKDVRGEYLKKVKESQQFMLKNLRKYYKDIGEYLKKPKISVIKIPDYGPVGGNPPAPTGLTSDEKDAVATGEGIGTGISIIQQMAGIKSSADVKKAVGNIALGKAEQYLSEKIESIGIAEVTATYNQLKEIAGAASDPGGYLYDKAVQSMIQQVAAVNKKYADDGDPHAQRVQEAAKKEMKHKTNPYGYIDADYMLSLLDKAYDNETKRLEQEALLEAQLPPTSASGRIWGAGLYEKLQVYAMTPGEPVAFSNAPSENTSSFDPNMLAALKKAGYDVPDNIPDQKIKTADFELDATLPMFNGKLSGTKMLSLPQGQQYPKLMVMFSISSPVEPYDFEWKGITIFDPPFIDKNDNEKEKCTYYVSTTGKNTNPGTIEAPFATLQYALNKAKACRDQKKEVSIILKSGIYRQAASINWNDGPSVPALNIVAAEPGNVIISAAEITNAEWQNTVGSWQANMPLHQQQPLWTSSQSSTANPPPAVIVNGQRMAFIPIAKNLPAPASYNISGNKVNLRPQAEVTNPNIATVEIGVRPFALKMTGVKNVTLSNLVFRYFPITGGNIYPGIIQLNGTQTNIHECNFQ